DPQSEEALARQEIPLQHLVDARKIFEHHSEDDKAHHYFHARQPATALGHSLQVRGKNREQKKRQRQSGGECQHPEQRPHASGLNRRRQQGFVLVDLYTRSEEHTSELQSRGHLVCRLLLEKKKEPTSAS